MKRKLLIVGDMRFMMKDIFGINDKEVDQVLRFMEKDFERVFDAIKVAAESDELTDRQKMLVSYIVGNTSGVMQARELDEIARDNSNMPHNISDVGM